MPLTYLEPKLILMRTKYTMKDKHTKRYHLASIAFFTLSSISLTGILFLDKFYWRTGVFPEGWPDFSFGHLMRSIVIFIAISAICWGLIGRKKPRFSLLGRSGVSIEILSILVTLSVATMFLFLFLFKTSLFSDLSLEDGIIEWDSAMLLFSACIVFIAAFVRHRNYPSIPKITQWTFISLAFAFFIITMEEISWFQRITEIETPELFKKDNKQEELNFHNFYTDKIENIYYFGAFIFLVVLPFLRILFSSVTNNNYLRLFVPRPFVAVIGAIACAYNFDMWNIIFIQISFFGSIIILCAFAIYCDNLSERSIIIFTILLVIATQVLFLGNGNDFSRIWEVTEYKEFFIPLGFFAYSLSIFSNVDKVYPVVPEKLQRA